VQNYWYPYIEQNKLLYMINIKGILICKSNFCEVRDFNTHKLSLLILATTEHRSFSICFDGKKRIFHSSSMSHSYHGFRILYPCQEQRNTKIVPMVKWFILGYAIIWQTCLYIYIYICHIPATDSKFCTHAMDSAIRLFIASYSYY
jgi:hypothetical protein